MLTSHPPTAASTFMATAAASMLLVLCHPAVAQVEAVSQAESKVVSAESDIPPRFLQTLGPVFRDHCVRCHGADDMVEGEVDLLSLRTDEDLLANPERIGQVLDALDTGFMPPADEPALEETTRRHAVVRLRAALEVSLRQHTSAAQPTIRRMNRFQYNNAVQDLFQLNVEVFSLPERMLREHGNYFQPASGRMPDIVQAGSRPLGKSQLIERRLAGVAAFPQDLRAEHGFDNRADHLTLSPLLLESFLRLGRSIVESDDFHAKTCGIWADFFAQPADDGRPLPDVVRDRLRLFLTRAFRRPVSEDRLDAYVAHVLSKIDAGAAFTTAMQDVAAAAIASPQFFYIYDSLTSEASHDGTDTDNDGQAVDDFSLASRLSFFLWGGIPDDTLLDLAQAGTLHQPEVLRRQVRRMLHDRRVKRFCDSFPSQWLQLERIISSTPDEDLYPQFYFAKYRASMHMMLEPLLLFETVLVENQSILQLIDSDFSYRSDLLTAWYADGSQGRAGSPTVVSFKRVPVTDRRYGGVITNAAVLTMTSGTQRTKPVTRGAWLASVILNTPPDPPPADVPPLPDQAGQDEENLTLRERFEAHRKHAACAGCHQQIDPLGFALENYNAVGVWRDTDHNDRSVDASGRLLGRYDFRDAVELKDVLLAEKDRVTRALAAHLLEFALGRDVGVRDTLALDAIVSATAAGDYRFHTLLEEIVLSEPFRTGR